MLKLMLKTLSSLCFVMGCSLAVAEDISCKFILDETSDIEHDNGILSLKGKEFQCLTTYEGQDDYTNCRLKGQPNGKVKYYIVLDRAEGEVYVFNFADRNKEMPGAVCTGSLEF